MILLLLWKHMIHGHSSDQKNEKSENVEHGTDYQGCANVLCLPAEDVNVDDSRHSSDPRDAQTDHFREESLLHVFHTLFHKLFRGMDDRQVYPRANEQFFYLHSQLLRRYLTERLALGMGKVAPLSIEAFGQSLGPGYSSGWFSWSALGNRSDNCQVPQPTLDELRGYYEEGMTEA